jgi:hypothetical protein
MVNELVNGHSPPAPDKRVQLKRKVLSLHDTLPTPTPLTNGVEYGVGEFLSVIQVYKKGSRARGGMIKNMMSPQYSHLNQSQWAVYNIIQEHEKGQMFGFDETWRDNGRPPIMKENEVDMFAEKIRSNPGEKNMREYVNDMLIKSATKKGCRCASDTKFNPPTINSYMALFPYKGGMIDQEQHCKD